MRRYAGLGTIAGRMSSALEHSRSNRALWARWVALIVLLVATPVTKHVVECIALVAHEVCEDDGGCGDCGDEPGPDSSPLSCSHCSHCTPPSTVPPALVPIMSAALAFEVDPVAPVELATSGYRSAPFRPPAA